MTAIAIPDFPARLNTVLAAVLADLIEGQRITHLDCWRKHGSSRLAHHIHVLRRDGWTIATDDRDVSTSDGRHQEIAEYSLPTDTIAAAGERGRQYIDAVREARAQRRAA